MTDELFGVDVNASGGIHRGNMGPGLARALTEIGHTQLREGNANANVLVGTIVDKNDDGITYLNPTGKTGKMAWNDIAANGCFLHFP